MFTEVRLYKSINFPSIMQALNLKKLTRPPLLPEIAPLCGGLEPQLTPEGVI